MKIKQGFVLQQVGGAYLAVATGSLAESYRALVRVNGSGAFLFRMMSEGDPTEEEMVRAMLDTYDVSAERAASDVRKFIQLLEEGGLIDD